MSVIVQSGEVKEITATGILMSPYCSEMPLKGRAIGIWNTIGDKLWEIGSRKILEAKYQPAAEKEEKQTEE